MFRDQSSLVEGEAGDLMSSRSLRHTSPLSEGATSRLVIDSISLHIVHNSALMNHTLVIAGANILKCEIVPELIGASRDPTR